MSGIWGGVTGRVRESKRKLDVTHWVPVTEDRAHIGPGPCCGYHIGDGYFYLWGYHHQMDLQTSTLRAPTLSLLGGKRGGDVAMPPHHTIPIIAFDPQNLSYRHSSGGIIFVPPRVSRTATFGPK